VISESDWYTHEVKQTDSVIKQKPMHRCRVKAPVAEPITQEGDIVYKLVGENGDGHSKGRDHGRGHWSVDTEARQGMASGISVNHQEV
jgi:nitrogen fixation protein FixH